MRFFSNFPTNLKQRNKWTLVSNIIHKGGIHDFNLLINELKINPPFINAYINVNGVNLDSLRQLKLLYLPPKLDIKVWEKIKIPHNTIYKISGDKNFIKALEEEQKLVEKKNERIKCNKGHVIGTIRLQKRKI